MLQSDIKEILENHQKRLMGECGGKRADLHDADLRGANLRGANLLGADLRDADLRGANLLGANLRDADLRGANLYDADLRDADLHDADLYDADLHDADLRGANLRGANLDFSCLPLWCGSLDMIVDRRIAAQIAYHFCSLVCGDEEVIRLQKLLYSFANTFHRVGEVPRLGDD